MKLPLWRVLAGFGVLGGLLAVLIALAPVCIDDYHLGGYMKILVIGSVSDEALRRQIVQKAHTLDLPVEPGAISISHPGGRLKVEARYIVEMNLGVYQVNLHFHPHAER